MFRMFLIWEDHLSNYWQAFICAIVKRNTKVIEAQQQIYAKFQTEQEEKNHSDHNYE